VSVKQWTVYFFSYLHPVVSFLRIVWYSNFWKEDKSSSDENDDDVDDDVMDVEDVANSLAHLNLRK